VKFDVERVRVVEVGPRDGLQNEKARIPVEARVKFVDALVEAGLRTVEIGAFVHPQWVPQMEGTEEVWSAIDRRDGVDYPVLVPNMKGLDRAIDAGVESIAIFTAASDTFNLRNINMSIDESFENYAPVTERARREGMRIRGYVSCACGCPYEGDIPAERVLEVAARLLDLGCYEVSIGDTIGHGTPVQVQGLVGLLSQVIPIGRLAMHFHDTRGMAVANTLAALECGITSYDASAGGLGGCPYAPGASGNVATEDLVYLFESLGIESGIDLDKLVDAAATIAPYLDHPLPGRYVQACRPNLQFGTSTPVQ